MSPAAAPGRAQSTESAERDSCTGCEGERARRTRLNPLVQWRRYSYGMSPAAAPGRAQSTESAERDSCTGCEGERARRLRESQLKPLVQWRRYSYGMSPAAAPGRAQSTESAERDSCTGCEGERARRTRVASLALHWEMALHLKPLVQWRRYSYGMSPAAAPGRAQSTESAERDSCTGCEGERARRTRVASLALHWEMALHVCHCVIGSHIHLGLVSQLRT
ncbi:unnamed protein product [Plutella xylostella]|uniref:(diamondback moth) hypothetical protein n=1 Tax=Plutella xylostella TaxID=51655 RepID=A0A8S4DQ01_PLUXY|nr:unnamed protein product [Plutella xylostella]